jgi:hypothetical protein
MSSTKQLLRGSVGRPDRSFWPIGWQVRSKLLEQPVPAAIRNDSMGTMPRYVHS